MPRIRRPRARLRAPARALLALAGAGALAGAAELAAGPVFVDIAPETGLDFLHFNGMTGELYFPEMTGQGGALFDYDNDGDLDAYLVQGRLLGAGETLADALLPPVPGTPLSDRLLRNDLAAAAGGGLEPRFVDVTEASGIVADGYGMGVAVGDVDDDGWPDLYVTNYGPNQLLRNNGDGTFTDVTEASGTGDPLWGTSASFFDADADGDLDLYVANYVHFDLERNPRCYATSSRRDYCGPSDFPGQPDRLYRNLGGGRFEEAAGRLLSDFRPGPGLGVVAADFNADGATDVYVANDGANNRLWINRGAGTFADDALFSGTAVSGQGRPEASMGLAAGDFDGDGDEDLFLTHLMGETNTLYVNDGTGLFADRTIEAGLAAPSLPLTAFGTAWIDYDNDGHLDLAVLNGAVRIQESAATAGDPFPLKQPNQLFRNLGDRFKEVTAGAGPAFGLLEVSRGAAVGDVDNDGDLDLLQLNNAGPARLLQNRVGQLGAWVGVAVSRAGGGRAHPGSVVEVRPAAAETRWLRAHADGSYCSARDPRVVAGLGAARRLESIRVRTAAGTQVELRRPPIRKYLRMIE